MPMNNKKNYIFLLKYHISKKKDKGMLTIERKKKPSTSNCVPYESPFQGGRKNNAFLESKLREFAVNIPALQ